MDVTWPLGVAPFVLVQKQIVPSLMVFALSFIGVWFALAVILNILGLSAMVTS